MASCLSHNLLCNREGLGIAKCSTGWVVREPAREQWMAWVAAWLGWTLDAFDFTIFLLIMVPISQTFDVPLVAVTAAFTVTLGLRLAGATLPVDRPTAA